MKDTSGLVASLNGYLKWNKARATCFLNMLLGLFAVRTINLQEIALAFSSDAKLNRVTTIAALFDGALLVDKFIGYLETCGTQSAVYWVLSRSLSSRFCCRGIATLSHY